MRLAILLGGALITSLLFGGSHNVEWGYTGKTGPSYWGDLDSQYILCKMGGSQSPINISSENKIKTIGLKPIKFNYSTESSSVINNGHTIQVNVKPGSTIKIDGKEFELKQFHFHSPSETQIEGKSFPLEAHFVHAAKDGSLAVISVMFIYGKDSEVIKKIWDKMPNEKGKKNNLTLSAKFINELLPGKRDYYRYDGSLTTPPCSEGVRWFVMKNYVQISKDQVEKFVHIMHHPNNRPVQPINARKVMY